MKLQDVKIEKINIFLKQVFTHQNKDLKIRILINNKNYKEISLDLNSKKISLKNIEDYLISGDNIITINILNPTTPLSKLTSIDGRLLGILVEEIEFN